MRKKVFLETFLATCPILVVDSVLHHVHSLVIVGRPFSDWLRFHFLYERHVVVEPKHWKHWQDVDVEVDVAALVWHCCEVVDGIVGLLSV